ncbi:O-antigen ligase family protein [Henriciella algicola]|uniref:O-antigen ligase family protein n=1 Tax=Henriciella algicola TaxID=1608422 RepID=A0A399RAH1_9PROT|nr:O-antigen ligase [Henriciella algicola]RIJ27773.1 O-antigen ligase family protein [Henriciella algicola]
MPASPTGLQDNQLTLTQTVILAVELGLAFVCLVLFSEGLLPRLFASEYDTDSSAFLRLLWLPVYGLVAIGCLWKVREMVSLALRMPFLIALLIVTAASFLWSLDPSLTERRSIAVVATSLAGLYLAARYDWRTLLRLMGAVWLFMAIVSIGAVIVAPGFAIMSEIHPGAWKGLWWEKNTLGGHMARAAFLCAFLYILDRPWRPVWGVAVFLCTALVIASTSKTALLGLMLGFGILFAGWISRKGAGITITCLWSGIVLSSAFAAIMIIEPGIILNLLGRDATLTGRTDIWAVLADAIADRPLLGYGYGAFWQLDSMPAYRVRSAAEWLVPTAHNGWLETALSVGLIGLGLLVANFVLFLLRAAWLSIDNWLGIFALGVAGQFLLFSISESNALQQNSIIWVTYVAIAAKTAISLKRPAATPYSPPRKTVASGGPGTPVLDRKGMLAR